MREVVNDVRGSEEERKVEEKEKEKKTDDEDEHEFFFFFRRVAPRLPTREKKKSSCMVFFFLSLCVSRLQSNPIPYLSLLFLPTIASMLVIDIREAHPRRRCPWR